MSQGKKNGLGIINYKEQKLTLANSNKIIIYCEDVVNLKE